MPRCLLVNNLAMDHRVEQALLEEIKFMYMLKWLLCRVMMLYVCNISRY